MTGLEKILKAIESDASASADVVIRRANQEADEIMANAKKEAEKKCAEIATKSDTEVKDILSRAGSAAALQEKKIILDAKQQMISNTIANAKTSLANLPDSEYIPIILQMAKKYAHHKAGEILFSEIDKKKLPASFQEMLQNTLIDKTGASLKLSEQSVMIEGGFILKYGDVEENCSFEALFAAAKEDLQDKVNEILFTTIEKAQSTSQLREK